VLHQSAAYVVGTDPNTMGKKASPPTLLITDCLGNAGQTAAPRRCAAGVYNC
jgi:hypothetical protein